jgi:putative membrane protein
MLPVHHTAMGLSLSSSTTMLIALVFFVSLLYVQGWRRIQRTFVRAISGWRLASFLLGMSLVWGALGSPLATHDHDLLTVHMIQHLLLMTFSPGLILLSEPLLVFWQGLPRFARVVLGPLLQRPLVQRLFRRRPRLALCWVISAFTLIAWHVPALFTLAMRSEMWHSIEQASFLSAGFVFWWPVVRIWPSLSTGPQWSTLLYLFLATVPCDILSGFLVFSDRVAYPVYFSMPRYMGLSVLEDQQCAAALMWTCVTLVYLMPATILSIRLLSRRSPYGRDLAQSTSCGGTREDRNPQGLEAV